MTGKDIINKVRWCIDKEASNNSAFDGLVEDDVFLNNIILSHINDALFWCSYYASPQLLNGASANSVLKQEVISSSDIICSEDGTFGTIILDEKFIRLVRVKMDGWHKAIGTLQLTEETSDEYAQLKQTVSGASNEQPKAAVIDTVPKRLEVYPYSDQGSLTIAVVPNATDGHTAESEVSIPMTMQTGFIYYLAYLTLSAYGDTSANAMLDIAKMNIGINKTND